MSKTHQNFPINVFLKNEKKKPLGAMKLRGAEGKFSFNIFFLLLAAKPTAQNRAISRRKVVCIHCQVEMQRNHPAIRLHLETWLRKQHQQPQKLLPILDVFGNSAREYNLLQADHPNSIYWQIPLSTSQQSTLVITARAETQEDSHTQTKSQTQTDRQTVHTHAHMSTHRSWQ